MMKDLIEQFKNIREVSKDDSTTSTSECVECGKPFQHYYKGNYKTCSKKCKKKRFNRRRNKRRNKKRKILRDYAEKNNLSERVVNHYGIDLLESNKELKESLQVIHMVNGRKNLPDEARRVREGLRKKSQDCHRERKLKNPEYKECKNCKEDFIPSIKHKTYCSDSCRDKKQRELHRERGRKHRENKYK